MTVEEYLKKDNSYLLIPRNTKNIFSRAFWEIAESKNREHTYVGRTGNQREAYERGVQVGWSTGIKEMERIKNIPFGSGVALSEQEYNDFMSLLTAFGYSFIYSIYNPMQDYYPHEKTSYHAGLNIIKNMNAIDAGVTISEDVKQKVYNLLKEYTDPIIWVHHE